MSESTANCPKKVADSQPSLVLGKGKLKASLAGSYDPHAPAFEESDWFEDPIQENSPAVFVQKRSPLQLWNRIP